jgi:hypothetical protein
MTPGLYPKTIEFCTNDSPNKPIKIIEDIDYITDHSSQKECEESAHAIKTISTTHVKPPKSKLSYNKELPSALNHYIKKYIKSNHTITASTKKDATKFSKKDTVKDKENAKDISFSSGSDSNTIIEHDCDNDYSFLCINSNEQ